MASSKRKLADESQPRPMQVIALGMSRTGTYSMYTALNMLGFKAYHCAEIRFDPPGAYDRWNEAMKAKLYGKGKKIGKAELDKLLHDYSAVTDVPCIMFTEELIAAYPDAKFLVTTRDEDSWVKSATTFFNTVLGWKWYIAGFDTVKVRPYVELLTIVWNHWTGGDWKDEQKLRQSFRDQYALVRSKIPEGQLLEFNPKEGWGPLCRHLNIKDKDIPQEPYPHVNDIAFTISIFDDLWWATFWKAAREVGQKALLSVAVVAIGIFVLRLQNRG